MNETKQRYKYVLADAIAALVAWSLFYAFRRMEIDDLQMGFHLINPQYNARIVLPLIPLFWFAIHWLSGYYNRKVLVFRSRLNELITTFVVTFLGVLLLFFSIVLDDPINEVGFSYFYVSFLLLFCLQFGFTYAFRLLITSFTIRKIRQGSITQPTLVVGVGKMAQQIRAEESKLRYSGHHVLGYVKVAEEDECSIMEGACVGKWEDLNELVEQMQVSVIIIADEKVRPIEVYKLIATFRYRTLTIKVMPKQYDWLKGSVELNHVHGIPLVDITTCHMPAWQRNVKRVFDVVFSTIALLLTLPMMALLCIGIGKKPLFKQERIGQRGRPFTIYKLRSMRLDAEKDGPQLSSETDARITPIGRFMRKYRIDELPQFYNVLKGDMSVVGPRPERAFYIEKIAQQAPYYYLLSKIRPGITSLGMVKYGYANTIEKMLERVNYELLYLDKMSLAFDVKILIYTIRTIFMGKGM